MSAETPGFARWIAGLDCQPGKTLRGSEGDTHERSAAVENIAGGGERRL